MNDAPKRLRTRRLPSFLLLVVVAALMTVGVASAASSSIEGVWSFNGGQIAVQPEGGGRFEGIVVQPTTFFACTHPVGQEIWKEIKLQPDGSYWGFHQWYKTASCVENPVLGPTAWRVVANANGTRYLRVCLSLPGTAQPTIPVGSEGLGASYKCVKSDLTAPLASSGVGTFKQVVSLPSSKKCLSVRKFVIHVRDSKFDPFKSVVITRQGHKIKVQHRGTFYVATINLKGLPRGAFTIKVKATTVRGHHVSGSRTYHTCTKGKKPTSKKH